MNKVSAIIKTRENLFQEVIERQKKKKFQHPQINNQKA